jgi:hypothetical protein
MKRLILAIVVLVYAAPSPQALAQTTTTAAPSSARVEIVGNWVGVLAVQGLKLRLALTVSSTAGGMLVAKLHSIDQGTKDLPVEEIALEGKVVRFSAKRPGLSFTGILDDAGGQIRGEIKQGAATMPITFARVTAVPVVARPQEPHKPYPYQEYEVRYTNASDGAQLAGTLTIPSTPGPHPAVILITGSGTQDRDETIAGHRPFLVLADHLTRRGIAVLRSDDRGAGGSSPGSADETSETFAGDVLAAVDFLQTRTDIEKTRIGVLGHSEGALIAVMAATRRADLAFVVMMAGTGQPGEAVILAQTEQAQRKYGVAPDIVRGTRSALRQVFAALRAHADPATALAAMRKALDDQAAALPESARIRFGAVRDSIVPQLKLYTTRWFRFFLDYDPATHLRQLRVPLLAVTGELDVQALPDQNLARIESEARSGGNANVSVRQLPRLNHLFQTAQTGLPDEYSTIEETVAPAALNLISQWIEERTRARQLREARDSRGRGSHVGDGAPRHCPAISVAHGRNGRRPELLVWQSVMQVVHPIVTTRRVRDARERASYIPDSPAVPS